MDSANACTGEHGDGKFRRHAHVDRDPISFFHAQRFQNVGEFLHLAMKLLIGEDANFPGLAFPNDRGFVFAPGREVTIDTVVGKIDLAANEPLRPGTIPFENFVPILEPVQFAGDSRPEPIGLVNGFLIQAVIFGEAFHMGLLAEFWGRIELALLMQDGIDASVLHVGCGFVGHDDLNKEEICFRPAARV